MACIRNKKLEDEHCETFIAQLSATKFLKEADGDWVVQKEA